MKLDIIKDVGLGQKLKSVRADACTGDSGGPVYSFDGGYKLNGLISFGPKHCGGGVPGVYTRVSSYVEWIEGVTGVDRDKVYKCVDGESESSSKNQIYSVSDSTRPRYFKNLLSMTMFYTLVRRVIEP